MTTGKEDEIIEAIDRSAVARGDGVQGRVVAYCPEPTVVVELASGGSRHVALSVFRSVWRIDPEPSAHARGIVEESLRRNADPGMYDDDGRVAAHRILEFARRVALEAVATSERDRV